MATKLQTDWTSGLGGKWYISITPFKYRMWTTTDYWQLLRKSKKIYLSKQRIKNRNWLLPKRRDKNKTNYFGINSTLVKISMITWLSWLTTLRIMWKQLVSILESMREKCHQFRKMKMIRHKIRKNPQWLLHLNMQIMTIRK